MKRNCLIGLLSFLILFLMVSAVSAQEWPTQTNVDPQKTWTIKFNSAVDPTTITSSNIYVDGVTTTVAPGADGKSIVVSPPVGGYEPGKNYYLHIGNPVKSVDGKNLKEENSKSFTITPKDTLPPAAPTGLNVTATKGQYSLTWNANTDLDLAGYHLWYKMNLSDQWTLTVSDTGSSLIKSTYFTFTDEPDGQLCYFNLTAVDKTGNESAPTETVNATTPATTYKTVYYEWEYAGRNWTWNAFKIPETEYNDILYSYRYNKLHPLMHVYANGTSPDARNYVNTYTLDRGDDTWISSVVTRLQNTCKDEGYYSRSAVDYIISFVQYLPYVTDIVSSGFDEYPRYPLETLLEGEGDCEDTSLLSAVMLREMGYGTAIIFLPGHAALGVLGDDSLPGYYFTVNGRKYYYLETTGTGWEVGEMPTELIGKSAFVLPVYNEVGSIVKMIGLGQETAMTVTDADNLPGNAIAVNNDLITAHK